MHKVHLEKVDIKDALSQQELEGYAKSREEF